MPEKLVLGPMSGGVKQNPLAFYIDNESFPQLVNAYPWRGRIKRKRGTSALGRLKRHFDSTSYSYTPGGTLPYRITLSGGAANLFTGPYVNASLTSFTLQANGNVIPTSLTIVDTTAAKTYTDPAGTGILVGAPSGSGTVNYATGAITIAAGASNTITVVMDYYPDLPVMGLEDLNLDTNNFASTLAFDTTYSYNIDTTNPYTIKDVSFYKNPATDAVNLPGYTPKSAQTPLTWNGQSYQQFGSVNYQNAFWVTNGTNVPFSAANIGMQFKAITGFAIITAGNGTNIPAVADITIVAHGLVHGDFLFINEVNGITGINFQTGYVTSADPQAANVVRVTFPIAILGGAYTTGGIAQYLTNRSDATKDCLRWYDGDPTINSGVNGWVNFSPPLFSALPSFGIDDSPPAQYYLVGAKVIINYKDRLLFFGPVIQTSTGTPIYLQDTVIYSQNGTPFYTSSFNGKTTSPAAILPVLVPVNQTATPSAYFEDKTGFGGFISAGYAQPITSVSPNEDTLIVAFTNRQTRFVYTGNDLVPFNFYIVNSELGTGSTFSTVNFDRGVFTTGNHGIIISNQIGSQRIDIDIPDQVFQFRLLDNGSERITAQRDFINEWIYLTYPDNEVKYKFPNQTLLYNYREGLWGIFNESYTTYGQFRRFSGYTWATIGTVYPTWGSWNDPWNSGSSTLLQPEIIAGNAQGFVIFKSDGTGESDSLYIQSFSSNTVTSPDHCLNQGDFIVISNCLGTIGANVNGKVFSVSNTTDNTFKLNSADPYQVYTGTYTGSGTIKRMYRPLIQSKQFQPSWGLGRKTRIGVQQYLFTGTNSSQVTVNIYLSQNLNTIYNFGPIVPDPNSINNSLIYSSLVYTCPESTNLGLTPANINLQMVTANPPFEESQIWHRMSTSLIGDTVQFGVSLSDIQMQDTTLTYQFAEIELHGAILELSPSQNLA